MILNVRQFDACVGFYRDLFGLETLFEERRGAFRLACLEFGGSYLMIETGGLAKPGAKPVGDNAAKLRFNVADIEAALAALKAYGIEAEIAVHDWGSTIDIRDPDGNRVGIRDDGTFTRQLYRQPGTTGSAE